jgi:hypothetical protein
MSETLLWLSCGVLRAELDELHRHGKIDGEVVYLDSMLHMAPPVLEKAITGKLEKYRRKAVRIVLVYGDCCPHMLDLVTEYRISRVMAINCAQMMAGRARYRELMHGEAFLLLPEWAHRWKEIMQVELGLSHAVAQELMKENRKELVYLDTGIVPVPSEALEECAEYT